MAKVGDSTNGGEASRSLNDFGMVIDIECVGVDSAEGSMGISGEGRCIVS